jgi:hypothetical protein
VEPLFEALEGADPGARPRAQGLAWKLLWAGIVFLALVVLVWKQAH